jgi:hypothetical protein
MFLEGTQEALQDRPVPDLDKYIAELAKARERHREFNRYALQEVRGRPWFARWRIALWVRRRFRQLRGRLREALQRVR